MNTSPDPRTLDRIRWRARRGMLENDLLLQRFLHQSLESMSPSELLVLNEILLLEDTDLLELLMERRVSDNPAHAAMISRICAAQH